MTDTPSTALSAVTTPLSATATDVLSIVDTLASYFLPGSGTVLGFTVTQIANIAVGIANDVPEFIALYDAVKAAADPSAPPPTADQWAAWGQAADDAHAAVAAAVAKVQAGG